MMLTMPKLSTKERTTVAMVLEYRMAVNKMPDDTSMSIRGVSIGTDVTKASNAPPTAIPRKKAATMAYR